MKIIRRAIAPAGRNKYGNYMSSGDITKSVTMVTYGGNNTTNSIGTTGTTNEDDMSQVNFYCMLLQTSCVFNETELDSNPSFSAQTLAYKGYDRALTLICDIDAVGATAADGAIVSDEDGNPIFDIPVNSGVTGIPTGMEMTTINNGTNASTIVFTAGPNLASNNESNGLIRIPVTVYKRDDNLPGDTLQNWYDHAYQVVSGETGWEIVKTNNCEVVWLEFTWNLNKRINGGGDGESAWYLTLDNDNASINADASGNIYTTAVRPTCKAKLYYGSTRQTNVTYNVDYGGAVGVTTSKSNGILTLNFGTGFTFPNDTVQITVSGSTSGTLRDVKIMNVTKSKAGANGADGASGQSAVSYWLEPNFAEIIYDGNNQTFSPSAITCSAYTQVGGNNPESASNATIKWKLQSRVNGAWGSESTYNDGIEITSAICESFQRLRLIMKTGSTPTIVDQEDIDILMDGMNGSQGLRGERGAAIRGPYDYYAVSGDSGVCWCAGDEIMYHDECECKNWIDVVLKDGVYYRCVSGYYGTLTDHFPDYWESGTSYDFVATRVLLAENAKINFLTNNELYLMDENGNVTGGARGGSGITFWAGGDLTGNTDNLPFRVMTDGTMYALNGVFGGYIQMKYTDMTELTSAGSQYATSKTYYLDNRAYVVASAGGIGSPNTLVLPTPTAALNGFVYYLLIVGVRAAIQTTSEGVACNVIVQNSGATILDYVYRPYGNRTFSRAGLYGGKYQFVCANVDGAFKWLLTEATGGAKLYGTSHDSSETDWRCFRPIFGFEEVDGTPTIKNIKKVSSIPSNTDDNTMYVV